MSATPGYSTVNKVTLVAQPMMSAIFQYDIASVAKDIFNTVGVQVPIGTTAAIVAKLINLPNLAEVVGGELDVLVVSNDSGTSTIAIGDSASASRYLGATTLKTLGRTALVPTGYIGAGEGIQGTWANQMFDATTGSARVRVEFVITGRASEVYPY